MCEPPRLSSQFWGASGRVIDVAGTTTRRVLRRPGPKRDLTPSQLRPLVQFRGVGDNGVSDARRKCDGGPVGMKSLIVQAASHPPLQRAARTGHPPFRNVKEDNKAGPPVHPGRRAGESALHEKPQVSQGRRDLGHPLLQVNFQPAANFTG